MPHSTWLCKTCAAEFPPSGNHPPACPICNDERQWVPAEGQEWVRTRDLAQTHTNLVREIEPGLFGIGVTPGFAIGQISFFIPDPDGGILWEGIPHMSDQTLAWIAQMGGVKTMVMSHPHLYGAMTTIAERLGHPEILLPEADREWVMHKGSDVQFFSGTVHALSDTVCVHVTGGHFEGSSILHWSGTRDRKGALLTGDTLFVSSDRQHVSFLYSTPNRVPLGLKAVRRIVTQTEPLAFDRLYSSWWGSTIDKDAKQAIARSEARWQRLLRAQ